MDLDSDHDLLDELSVSGKSQQRPVFLTVLCVLTFVGSALYLLYAYYTFTLISGIDDTTADILQDTELVNYYKWYKIERYAVILGAIGCSVGAYFMLKLRRIGFYFYVAAQILPVAVGAFTMTSIGGLGGFQFISLILSAIFPVGFIILYSLNYKYLK